MILVGILIVMVAAIAGFLVLLPAWDPIDVSALWVALDSGPAAQLFGFFAWANYYLPIKELLAISVLRLAIWAGVYVVRFLIWILQLFHIAGGGSNG
jgi:hypothetical protein